MNVGQIETAAKLLAEHAGDARDICALLELGSEGCLLRLGVNVPGSARREWIIARDGSAREYA